MVTDKPHFLTETLARAIPEILIHHGSSHIERLRVVVFDDVICVDFDDLELLRAFLSDTLVRTEHFAASDLDQWAGVETGQCDAGIPDTDLEHVLGKACAGVAESLDCLRRRLLTVECHKARDRIHRDIVWETNVQTVEDFVPIEWLLNDRE